MRMRFPSCKRSLSLILCVAFLSLLCSCAGKDKLVEEEKEYAVRFCDAVISRDSGTVKELAPLSVESIDEVFSLSSSGSSSLDIEAREAVASTLSYEIESASSDRVGTSGSVSVKFTYTDYRLLVSEDSEGHVPDFDIDTFREDLAASTDKVSVTLSLRFKVGVTGKVECVEASDPTLLFEYWDRDFDLVGPLYMSPSDGVVDIPSTSLVIELPAGFSCISASDPDYYTRVVGMLGEDAHDAVFYAVSGYDVISVWHLADIPYNDPSGADYIASVLSEASYFMENAGPEYTITTRDYYSGGQSYTVYTMDLSVDPSAVDIEEGLTGQLYVSYVLIGDEDSCYVLCVFAESSEIVDEVMNCIAP